MVAETKLRAVGGPFDGEEFEAMPPGDKPYLRVVRAFVFHYRQVDGELRLERVLPLEDDMTISSTRKNPDGTL